VGRKREGKTNVLMRKLEKRGGGGKTGAWGGKKKEGDETSYLSVGIPAEGGKKGKKKEKGGGGGKRAA